MKPSNTSENTYAGFNHQAYYVLSKNWQSDLAFFGDELRFFKKLVNKYFIWLNQDENIALTEDLISRLIKLEKDRVELIEKINIHLLRINSLIRNGGSQHFNENIIMQEHADLEIDTAVFTKRFRDVKKEVFKITEDIMESERLIHLLER